MRKGKTIQIRQRIQIQKRIEIQKRIQMILLCILLLFGFGSVNAYADEVKAYSSDYRIELFGNCVYGAVVIQNDIYIPLEMFISFDNYHGVRLNKNGGYYTLYMNSDSYALPAKQDTSQIPFSWVEMGNVQSEQINLTVNYDEKETKISDGFYTFKGEYPMIKLSKLQECIPITIDYENRIITIGDNSKFANLPTEADLVGQVFPEIANRSWDSVTNMKSIHDYLVKTLYYAALEYEDAPELQEVKQNYVYRNNYTLASQGAICEQYARLFRDLCRRSGIACMTVSGSAGESHEWNKVFVNNEWVYVDVTFDDPINNGKNSPNIRHDYFMKTAEDMQVTHYWQGNDYPPLPEYSEDWKNLDCNNITSREMYYKCFIGQLAKGNSHIELKVTAPGAYGGIAFLSYYSGEGIFQFWSMSGSYQNGKYVFDVNTD